MERRVGGLRLGLPLLARYNFWTRYPEIFIGSSDSHDTADEVDIRTVIRTGEDVLHTIIFTDPGPRLSLPNQP